MQQRYAKWKATEIHKCLQRGETPISGPAGSEFENAELGGGTGPSNIGGDPFSNNPQQQQQPPQQPTPAPRRVSILQNIIPNSYENLEFHEIIKLYYSLNRKSK